MFKKHAACLSVLALVCAIVFIPIYAVLVASGLLPSRLSAAPWSEILAQAAFQGVMSVLVSGISFAMMVRHYGPVRTTMIESSRMS